MTPATSSRRMLRPAGVAPTTSIELFFDLVYVFAVTQLSHQLLTNVTLEGALQTALLLAMVWLVWVYTTWVTNWLNPDRTPVRLLLLALMLLSLVMSAELPHAFDDRGLVVGVAYAVIQIGRSAFTVVVLRGESLSLERNFQRILVWCVLSGAFAVVGGIVHGHAREVLWLAAIAVDLVGGVAGFATPGLGRSRTSDWTIEGRHFADRCQAFVLIALGESLLSTGEQLADQQHLPARVVVAFLAAFAGAAALWWIYFDRSADEAADLIAESADPGRLGTYAYHFIHPLIIGGIIVTAAADVLVIEESGHDATTGSAWLVFGGTALFLAGHAAFKAVIWRVVPVSRIVAVLVLLALVPSGHRFTLLLLELCALVVVLGVIVADLIGHRDVR